MPGMRECNQRILSCTRLLVHPVDALHADLGGDELLADGRTSVRVFVEVAMISVIREMIVQPVQVISTSGGHDESFSPLHYGLLLAALLVIGVVYRLVSDSEPNEAVATAEVKK